MMTIQENYLRIMKKWCHKIAYFYLASHFQLGMHNDQNGTVQSISLILCKIFCEFDIMGKGVINTL